MQTRLINFLSHLAGWILFFSLILAFLAGPREGEQGILSLVATWPFLLFATVFLSLFYLNYFLFVPRLFLQKKYLAYFSIVVLLFAAVYAIKPFDRMISMNPPPFGPFEKERREPPTEGADGFQPNQPEPGGPGKKQEQRVPRSNRDINSIILFVTIMSISSFLPVMRQWRLTEQRALQAETDRTHAELSFLKAQINPHFLFNTLNNIYSMAVTRHEHTAPSILKLSNIMRYVTDEAGQDLVPLENEVACMKDYIGLQELRLGQQTSLQVDIIGSLEEKKIPPLLLMTFVENLFKYGVSKHEASRISIRLEAGAEELHFHTSNRLFPVQAKAERTGIGIANARQRLEHLYPGRYQLQIQSANELFVVDLRLPL